MLKVCFKKIASAKNSRITKKQGYKEARIAKAKMSRSKVLQSIYKAQNQ